MDNNILTTYHYLFSLSTKKKPSFIHLFPKKADLNQMNNIIFMVYFGTWKMCGGLDSDGNMCRGMRTRHLPERDAWLWQDSLARVQAIQVFCHLCTTEQYEYNIIPLNEPTAWVFSAEAKFLDDIWTKVLRVFLLVIHSHLYSFALIFLFLQTQGTSWSFCKGERRKTW